MRRTTKNDVSGAIWCFYGECGGESGQKTSLPPPLQDKLGVCPKFWDAETSTINGWYIRIRVEKIYAEIFDNPDISKCIVMLF